MTETKSTPRKSYVRTPEHKEKMRLATKGRVFSEETKRKLRKPKSEAAKRALSMSAKSPEVVAKRKATMLEKYGVAHAKQISEKNPNRVEYWILRGMSEQEASELISSRQKELASRVVNRISHWGMEYWRKKGYSDEEAKERISELQRSNSAKSDICVSDIGTRFLDDIQCLSGINIDREVSVGPFVVDGVVESHKTAIEFFGDFWHMNPAIFKPDDIHPVTGWKASSKWNEDSGRVKYMESMGYTVFVVWETDFIDHGNELVISIAEAIKNANQ